MDENEKDLLTGKIIGCCFEVHSKLGPGFLEKIYVNALKVKLQQLKIAFQCERQFDVKFDDIFVGKFRCDFLIDNKLIIEIKAVTGYQPKLFQSQLISYLKASGMKTGLLINFGNASCEIKRISV